MLAGPGFGVIRWSVQGGKSSGSVVREMRPFTHAPREVHDGGRTACVGGRNIQVRQLLRPKGRGWTEGVWPEVVTRLPGTNAGLGVAGRDAAEEHGTCSKAKINTKGVI